MRNLILLLLNIKYKMNKYLSLILVLLLQSCNSSMESKITKLQSFSIDLCLDDMTCIYSKNDFDIDSYYQEIETAKYIVVVYMDSEECMSCNIGKLHAWDSYISKIAEFNSVEIVFIFSPRIEDGENLKTLLLIEKLKFPVFVDTKGTFTLKNKHIPTDLYLHTFLINEKKEVVLVGDPRRNKRIDHLYDSIISFQYTNIQ